VYGAAYVSANHSERKKWTLRVRETLFSSRNPVLDVCAYEPPNYESNEGFFFSFLRHADGERTFKFEKKITSKKLCPSSQFIIWAFLGLEKSSRALNIQRVSRSYTADTMTWTKFLTKHYIIYSTETEQKRNSKLKTVEYPSESREKQFLIPDFQFW